MRHFETHNIHVLNHSNGYTVYNSENGKIALIKKEVIKQELFKGSNEETKMITNKLKDQDFFTSDKKIDSFKSELPLKMKYEQLYLIVSDGCNMSCKYCRQGKNLNYKNMTFGEIEEAVESFFEVGKNLKSVVFYGGEPLLNADGVFHAIEYIRNRTKHDDFEVDFSLITNGTLVDMEMAKRLAKYKVSVIVSIDGPEKNNDQARVSKDGLGTYKRSLKGFQYLKVAGCCVGTNSTIGPHNQNDFDDLVKWLVDIRPNTVGFALPHGSKENYAMGIDFGKMYDHIIDSFEFLSFHGISQIHVERKLKDVIANNVNSFECRASQNRVVACPEGKYGVCEGAVTNDSMFFDSINEIHKTAYEYQKTSPLNLDDCRNCIAIRICGGGCPYDKLMRYGRIDCVDPFKCGFIQRVMKYSLKYINERMITDSSTSIEMLTDDKRKELLQGLNFSKEGFVPLDYNCDARVDK